MKKTNFKLFTMFLAGIAFSALTVFAATISISTNFEDGAIQYLKKLVILMDNNNTWITLDWDTLTWKNIYGDNIKWNTFTGSSIYGGRGMFEKYCNYGWTDCVSYEDLTQWWWESLWNTWNNNQIYYSTGNVGIGTNNPNQKLVVNGTGLFSGLKVNSIAQFDNGIFLSNISGNTIATTNPSNTLNFKASGYVFNVLNNNKHIQINSSWYLWIWLGGLTPQEALHVNGTVQIWQTDHLKLSTASYPALSAIESSTKKITFITYSGEDRSNTLNIHHSWVTIWGMNTSPSEKLVVDGTGKFTAGIKATNGTFTNWYFGDYLQLFSNNIMSTIKFTNKLRFLKWSLQVMSINSSWNVQIDSNNTQDARAKLDIDWGLMLWEDTCNKNSDVWKLSLLSENQWSWKMLVICWYNWDNQNNRERIPIIFISWSGGWVYPTSTGFSIASGFYDQAVPVP